MQLETNKLPKLGDVPRGPLLPLVPSKREEFAACLSVLCSPDLCCPKSGKSLPERSHSSRAGQEPVKEEKDHLRGKESDHHVHRIPRKKVLLVTEANTRSI